MLVSLNGRDSQTYFDYVLILHTYELRLSMTVHVFHCFYLTVVVKKCASHCPPIYLYKLILIKPCTPIVMPTHQFRLTSRMINEKALGLLKQYTTHMVSFNYAMGGIQDILGSAFDEDEWMDLTQCILMNADCFSDVERAFKEQLGMQGDTGMF